MDKEMSEPKRYTAAGSGVVKTDPKGDLVLYLDYARLMSELDELKSQPDPLTAYLYAAELAKDDIKRLKAEVERLTERLGGVRLIVTEEMYDELNTKYLEQQHELQNIALTARQILDEKIDLKEQVERLTKAGDAMVDMVDWEVPYERRKKLEADWNAAKEGKPRA
jgi:hypothetical protein